MKEASDVSADQHACFLETARQLGCDEDKAAFSKKLKRHSEIEEGSGAETARNLSGRGMRRVTFDDADVAVLTASPRFVVAIDAYMTGCCTTGQILRLAFTEPPYVPRDLSWRAFANLVFHVTDLIKSGTLIVASAEKERFAHFYEAQEPPLID